MLTVSVSSPGPAAGTLSSGVRPAVSARWDTSCPAPPGSDAPASDWPPPDSGPESTNQRWARYKKLSDVMTWSILMLLKASWQKKKQSSNGRIREKVRKIMLFFWKSYFFINSTQLRKLKQLSQTLFWIILLQLVTDYLNVHYSLLLYWPFVSVHSKLLWEFCYFYVLFLFCYKQKFPPHPSKKNDSTSLYSVQAKTRFMFKAFKNYNYESQYTFGLHLLLLDSSGTGLERIVCVSCIKE